MTRLLTALALGLVLQATAHVAGSVADEVSGTHLVSAHAQFTGKIKRIRIKKRRVGSGFKVISRSTSTSSNVVASAQVKIAAGDGSEVGTFTTNVQDVQVFETALTDFNADVDVTAMAFAILTGTSDDAARQEFDVELFRNDDGSFDGFAIFDGYTLTAHIEDGVLTAKVQAPQYAGNVQVAVQRPEGDLFMEAVEVRQVANMTTDLPLDTYGLLTVETTLFGEDGSVVDARSETLQPGAAAYSAGLDKISARSTKKGGTKLVTWTTTQSDDNALTLAVRDAETQEVVVDAVSTEPTLTQRSFLSGDVSFEEESVEGFTYLVLLDALDAEGNPTGAQHEAELVIPPTYDGAVGATYASFADGAGVIGILSDDNGYYFTTAMRGDAATNVASMNIIFEEPYEGPAPLELEVSTEYMVQFDKWVTTSATPLPAAVEVRAELSGDGTVLGAVDGATGVGAGTVYKKDKVKKEETEEGEETNFGFLEITRG